MVWGKLLCMSAGLGCGNPCTWLGSHLFFLRGKRKGAPYRLILGWIQPYSRYVSSRLCTSDYSTGDELYCLVLVGWASGSSKVMSCVTWSQGKNMGSLNISENSSNKAEIYRSLAPGAKGVWGPFYSLSRTLLATIARRLPDGHNNVNQAALCYLQTVYFKHLKEHDNVPSTT